jgi:hypothetical protein
MIPECLIYLFGEDKWKTNKGEHKGKTTIFYEILDEGNK